MDENEYNPSYCFLCFAISHKREVTHYNKGTGQHVVGYECASCGGVSMKRYKVCPQHGAPCRQHLPLE